MNRQTWRPNQKHGERPYICEEFKCHCVKPARQADTQTPRLCPPTGLGVVYDERRSPNGGSQCQVVRAL
jgi:hypothetical protein